MELNMEVNREARVVQVRVMRVLVLSDTHSPRRWKVLPARPAAPPRRRRRHPPRGRRVHPRRARPALHVRAGARRHGQQRRARGGRVGCPETLEVELEGVRIGMIHDSGQREGRAARLRRRFPRADLVVFGHSHIPLDETGDGVRILNPGSPTDRRRQPAGTFANLLDCRTERWSRRGSSSCPAEVLLGPGESRVGIDLNGRILFD